jgi:hypothetical protein
MSGSEEPSILEALVGSELSSVVFVQDYIQLVFQPTETGRPPKGVLPAPTAGSFGTLSAFVLPELETQDRRLRPGEAGYRDLLVEQINWRVPMKMGTGCRLSSTAVVATLPLDRDVVESAMLQLGEPSRRWMVWSPGD